MRLGKRVGDEDAAICSGTLTEIRDWVLWRMKLKRLDENGRVKNFSLMRNLSSRQHFSELKGKNEQSDQRRELDKVRSGKCCEANLS